MHIHKHEVVAAGRHSTSVYFYPNTAFTAGQIVRTVFFLKVIANLVVFLIECRFACVQLHHIFGKFKVAVFVLVIAECTEIVVICAVAAGWNRVRRRIIYHVVVVPRCNAVDIIRIVVAVLSPSELIAVNNHRNSAAHHLDGDIIACRLTFILFLRRLRHEAQSIVIVVAAVALTERPSYILILCVSLSLIAAQVGKSKAVMRNNKVYGFMRSAFLIKVIIIAVDKVVYASAISGSDITSDCIAVTSVPAAPAFREVSYLVGIFACIPAFGNHFYIVVIAQCDNIFKGFGVNIVVPFVAGFFAPQCGCKVKAETVNAHIRNPVFK